MPTAHSPRAIMMTSSGAIPRSSVDLTELSMGTSSAGSNDRVGWQRRSRDPHPKRALRARIDRSGASPGRRDVDADRDRFGPVDGGDLAARQEVHARK